MRPVRQTDLSVFEVRIGCRVLVQVEEMGLDGVNTLAVILARVGNAGSVDRKEY